MDSRKNRGAITVYLSIILSAVIILSGVLMDIVRIRAAEVQVRRALNTSAISVLAGYDSRLKEQYGLFALHNSGAMYLNETIEDYFGKNLLADMGDLDSEHKAYNFLKDIVLDDRYKDVDFVDLYNYKIEDISVTPIYNFTENEIIRQQITEYMKYRAPVQFAENFMEKVDYAASAGELSSVYKQKTSIEKKLKNIEKAMKRLQEHVNEINKFEKINYNCSPEANSPIMTFCRSIILKEIYRECMKANLGNLDTPEERKRAYEVKVKINELYQMAVDQAAKSKELLDEQLLICLDSVSDARQELVAIQALSRQARQDIDNLKSFLEGLKEQNQSGKINNSELIAAMEKDIERYQNLLDAEKSQSISDKLNNNYEVLSFIRTSTSDLASWVTSQSVQLCKEATEELESSFSADVVNQYAFNELIRKLSSDAKLKSIENVANQYLKIENILIENKERKGTDPRKETAEAAKKIRKGIQGSDSSTKNIENPKLLPSYYASGGYPNKLYSEDIVTEQVPDYEDLEVVEKFDVDFDEDSSFVDDGFDFIVNFAQRLKDAALDTRDEIYVDEYILKNFKDAVEISDSNTDGKSSSTFFEKGEVEYILGGNANEEVNKYLVRGQILLLRFGMNTLHVYSDPQKRLQALEVATAVAGFTGFGIPIAHNLIMCAWGTAEAFCDIDDIYAGKKVPFIKTAENWKTDLLSSGFKAKENAQSKSGLMDFDYHDYLRLLLLTKNSEAKMNRIEDLLQLNIQLNNPEFKLHSCKTYMKVNAQVSIKYWFITKLFVPSKYKTDDGNRHLVNVEIWRGY